MPQLKCTCGSVIDVPRNYVGASVRCLKCLSSIELPAPVATATADAPRRAAPAAAPPANGGPEKQDPVRRLLQTITASQELIQNVQATIQTLQQSLAEREVALAHAEQQLEGQRKAHEKKVVELQESSAAKLRSMEEEVGRLKPFESKAKEREEAAGKSKQESERKIEELKKKNQELEAQTTDRFEKLEKELKQERSQRESAASKMAGNDEEVQKARDLAAQLDQVVHDREEELGFLKQQLEAQKQAYEAQFKAMQSRKAEPMTSSEEAKNLKAQVQSITAERETLKTQLAATAQVLNTHKNLMVRAQAELAEKRVRIAELEASAKGAGAASEPEEAPIEEEAPEEEIDYSHIGLVRFHETKAAILRQGSSNSICVELVAVGDRMMCATVNESLNPGATVSVTLEMSKFGSKVQASAQVHSQAILKLNKLYEVNLVFTKVSDEDRSRLRAALRYYYMSK